MSSIGIITNTSGTTTVRSSHDGGADQGINEIVLDWLSTSGGAVNCTIGPIKGEIIGFETIPDGGGTAPTVNYDVELRDRYALDLLGGGGANRSDTAVERIAGFDTMALRKAFSGPLTLVIANAGSAKGGIVLVHVRP